MIQHWFQVCCEKTSLHPMALYRISQDLLANRSRLIKHNNFFAIGPGSGANYRSYPTPAAGIQAGIDLITKHPEFVSRKIGTLKANPDAQYRRIASMLGIFASP